MSAYRAALDLTARTVDRRATRFRNQVVAVVLIGAASLACSLGTRSPAPLAGLALLVPACGLFFWADAALLGAWAAALAPDWTARDLDFVALRAALRANPALPADTTEAMLAMLPSAGDVVAERRALTPTRRAVAAAVTAAHRARARALLLDTAVSGVAAGGIVAASWTRTAIPLLGLAALTLRPLLGREVRRGPRASNAAELAACRQEPGFDEREYARLLASVAAAREFAPPA